MNSISANLFNGDLEAIFQEFQSRGVTQVDLTPSDFNAEHRAIERLKALSSQYGVSMSSVTGLSEFGGNSNHVHEYDMQMARNYLKHLQGLNCRLLVVTPPTMRSKLIDHNQIIKDLAALANLAIPLNINIALKSLPWSPYIGSYEEAITVVEQVKSPNFGMVIDTFHFLNDGEDLSILDKIDLNNVFKVQCSDFDISLTNSVEEQILASKEKRLMVGDGYFTDEIVAFAKQIREAGYQGGFSIYANESRYQIMGHGELIDRFLALPLD